MRLEPLTVTVMVGLLAILCAAFLIIIRLFFPRSVRGLNAWLIGSALLVFGSLLHGLKEVTGSAWLILLANCLVLSGIMLFWVGLQRFYQKPPLSHWRLGGLLAVVAALISWFTWGHDDFQARMLVMTSVQTCLFVAIVVYLQSVQVKRLGHRLIMSAYSLAAMISLTRMLTVLWAHQELDTFLGVSVIHIVYLASFSFTWLLSTMGFIALIIEELQSRLVYLAAHDVLTGMLNRGAFFNEAQQRFELARKRRQPVTVLLFDVDHFKRINDRYGHQEGDQVLVTFCQCIRQTLGPDVIVGRYGGEEFVALLVGHGAADAVLIAERVREAVSVKLSVWQVTVSVGVAVNPDVKTMDDLLGLADEALYRAKNLGRNQVVLAHADLMTAKAHEGKGA